jgi:hypothetical protein
MRNQLESGHAWHLGVAAAGLAALLLARPVPAQVSVLHDVAALAAQLRGFAGAAPRLDPRLVVPRCPSPALSWARADVVRVDCAAPAWTLYVPVEGAPAAQAVSRPRPAIRRGEKVMVDAAGPGFAVAVEAEAERDADGSRIALKSPTGRRFTARIEDSGKVVLAR